MSKLTRLTSLSMALSCSMALCCLIAPLCSAAAQALEGVSGAGAERLGTVSFSVSCGEAVAAAFNRGVSLLHDFWYDEARRQFERIAQAEPTCAMAHWGIAMSTYHQIWDRPDAAAMALAWGEIQRAAASPRKSARERAYVAALARFFQPGKQDYQARVEAYAAAMSELYVRYPHDPDVGAFYALSLLAAEAPEDTSLAQEHKALAVLEPLFSTYPEHPGLAHYIIHACDTPSLASQGLAAAKRYGDIAPSAPHAVHMPGHIFARLGMWREDIRANLASVAASRAAQARHESDGFDELHADDFLLYAYLQSGQEERAATLIDETAQLLTSHSMHSMSAYYGTKLPAIYALEVRDWAAAAALEPWQDARPETKALTYWARIVAEGHLHRPQEAQADFVVYEALLEQVKHGPRDFLASTTAAAVERGEIDAWLAFAGDDSAAALKHMRTSADLQDRVGQGETDIPAREMLADMLLELHQPALARIEYERALNLSPKRFNGLYGAGRASEAARDRARALDYYTILLDSTDHGSQSNRQEFEHVKNFVSAMKIDVPGEK